MAVIHVGVNECAVDERVVEREGEMRPRKTFSFRDSELLQLIVSDLDNEVEHDGLIYGYRYEGGNEIVVHQRRRISIRERILRHPNPLLRAKEDNDDEMKAAEAFAERAWSCNS